MTVLFSREWAEGFAQRWNNDQEMVGPLSAAGFKAIVAFGYNDQDHPSALIQVDRGQVVKAGTYDARLSPAPDWDLRAAPQQWGEWQKDGLSLIKLGVTVASGQLEFRNGDYRKMIRTPSLAAPFLRCFKIL